MYEIGDELFLIMGKNSLDADFYGSLGGTNGEFYITEKNGIRYANKTLGGFIEVQGEKVEDDEKLIIKNGVEENPLHIVQRFKIDKFIEVYKEKYEEKYNKKYLE